MAIRHSKAIKKIWSANFTDLNRFSLIYLQSNPCLSAQIRNPRLKGRTGEANLFAFFSIVAMANNKEVKSECSRTLLVYFKIFLLQPKSYID